VKKLNVYFVPGEERIHKGTKIPKGYPKLSKDPYNTEAI
jgi:hypothetical protein